ncbi:hypothetical protein EDD86DRAFT_246139 [Gorgonomyces haynaldii]|nr:hypothetical protein EDD86DRAFT_246139 [Gorgonomyces haynaldii]
MSLLSLSPELLSNCSKYLNIDSYLAFYSTCRATSVHSALCSQRIASTEMYKMCFLKGFTPLCQLLIKRNRIQRVTVTPEDLSHYYPLSDFITPQSELSLLQLAVGSGNLSLCKLLLPSGSGDSEDLLMLSVILGHVDLCRLFYSHGDRFSPHDDPMLLGVKYGHLEPRDDALKQVMDGNLQEFKEQLERVHCKSAPHGTMWPRY